MSTALSRRRLGIAGMAAGLSACAGSGGPRSRGPARIGFGASIESLDPMMAINAYPLFRSLFDQLTYVAADGALTGRLAYAWSAGEAGRSWTFRLRDDHRWSDGPRVSLQDALFSFQTVRAEAASLNHPYLQAVVGLERVGADGLRFDLSRPFASWPRQLTLLSIVPERSYRALGPAGFARRPVGSGPYAVAEWGARLRLRANPYSPEPPPLEQVEVLSIPDEAARLNALQAGDVDAAALNPHQVPALLRRPDLARVVSPSNRVVYLGLPPKGPLADVRVRQAIDCAVDREAICRYLLRGAAQPAGQLVAPGVFGHDPRLLPPDFDPGRARRLLAQAGYGGALVVLQYPTAGPIPLVGLLAEALQGQLSNVGLRVVLRGVEQNTFIGDWFGGALRGVYLFAFNPSTMDASLVTSSLLGPRGVRRFSDPVMDALEARQERELDPAARAAVFARMWARNREQAYYAPLFNDVYAYAYEAARLTLRPRRDGYITPQELGPPTRA